MYFASKRDIWFFVMFWGVILFIILLYLFGSDPVGTQFITYKSVFGYIFSGVSIGFLVWIWFGTGYKVEDGKIKIHFGPIKFAIHIKDIKKVSKAKSIFTAPALSVDRIEILYGKYNVMKLSPQNEKEFIRLLLEENCQIKLDHHD